MDDIFGVDISQTLTQGSSYVYDLFIVQLTRCNQLRERLSAEHLHDEVAFC